MNGCFCLYRKEFVNESIQKTFVQEVKIKTHEQETWIIPVEDKMCSPLNLLDAKAMGPQGLALKSKLLQTGRVESNSPRRASLSGALKANTDHYLEHKILSGLKNSEKRTRCSSWPSCEYRSESLYSTSWACLVSCAFERMYHIWWPKWSVNVLWIM